MARCCGPFVVLRRNSRLRLAFPVVEPGGLEPPTPCLQSLVLVTNAPADLNRSCVRNHRRSGRCRSERPERNAMRNCRSSTSPSRQNATVGVLFLEMSQSASHGDNDQPNSPNGPVVCRVCDGWAELTHFVCPTCDSTGQIKKQDRINRRLMNPLIDTAHTNAWLISRVEDGDVRGDELRDLLIVTQKAIESNRKLIDAIAFRAVLDGGDA